MAGPTAPPKMPKGFGNTAPEKPAAAAVAPPDDSDKPKKEKPRVFSSLADAEAEAATREAGGRRIFQSKVAGSDKFAVAFNKDQAARVIMEDAGFAIDEVGKAKVARSKGIAPKDLLELVAKCISDPKMREEVLAKMSQEMDKAE